MKTIQDISFSGKQALIRVDFNVPLNEQKQVTDDTRIRAALPTIQHILKEGGSVVLMSHLGRPQGEDMQFSLRTVAEHLQSLISNSVQFCASCVGAEAEAASKALQPGSILLLENLRFHVQETTGDAIFTDQLAKHGDVYVNDAFGTAHRAHASTAIIASRFIAKCFGFLIENELKSIDLALNSGKKPLTAIIGGAKVSSKITIMETLLDSVDHMIVGGGMAFTFVRALGGTTGSSLVEEDQIGTAKRILAAAKEKGVQIHLPSDAIIADAFSASANIQTCNIMDIPKGWMGLDIGPETIQNYCSVIQKSGTILWNGPMGVFELEPFQKGTKDVALSLAGATKNQGTFTLVGGGDSVAAVNLFNLADQVSYVSTGGGAMLEYLEGKELPGIAAIKFG
jgi:phosphoglycerate kinase